MLHLLARMLLASMMAATECHTGCAGDDTAEADLVRKTSGVEIQAIAIYEPDEYLIHNGDIKDWPRLMTLLQQKVGPASKFRDLFPKKLQEKYDDTELVLREMRHEGSSDLGVETLSAFRKLLSNKDLYSEVAFKDLKFDKETKKLLDLKTADRTYFQVLSLNRRLLNLAYPDCTKAVPVDYHTAQVKVLSGEAVVLVLSSYRCCHWKIEVSPGAKVIGVVLCGYEAQEVEGIESHVYYRSQHTKMGDVSELGSYQFVKQTDASYVRASADFKKLLGHEIESLQSRIRPGRKIFEIGKRK